jgi:hypothetical protein
MISKNIYFLGERSYSENETGRRMPPRMKRMAKYCRNLWEPAEPLIKSQFRNPDATLIIIQPRLWLVFFHTTVCQTSLILIDGYNYKINPRLKIDKHLRFLTKFGG